MEKLINMPVKHQYTLVQALYWVTSCALGGYAAVYLQYRGLSNTLIGVVVGGAACLSMGVQPLAAQIAENFRAFTVKRMLLLMISAIAVLFGVLTLAPLSIAGVMLVYIAMNTVNNSLPPLLSAMGMEFINRGYYLNFGISRGMGSISFAVCAAVLGFVIERFRPGILGYVYIVLAVLLFLAILAMKDLGREKITVRDSRETGGNEGIFGSIVKNPVFLSLMAGFCLANINNAAIGTYTVNIVKRLGGTDSVLGIANFVSAASEMPVMLLFGYFMKRSNCIRLLKISAFFFLLKPLLLFWAGSLPGAFLGLAMQGLSFGLFTPAAVYYVNSTIAPEMRVKGQAVFSMITAGAATCAGNLMGGWVQDAFGLKTMLGVCVCIALAGFLIILRLPDETERVPVRYRIQRWIYHRGRKLKGSGM